MSKSVSEWKEIYDKKGSSYPDWLKAKIDESEGSLDNWLDNERLDGNTCDGRVYLGDGIYL